MTAKAKRKLWTMPIWMEPYRELIINTGGNSVEELMNDDTSPLINLPRSILAACVKSQVGFLSLLYERRMLSFTTPQRIAKRR
jgi:hypothetical protein